MPEPYRGLLVHGKDMTSTLEAFHGESIELRPVVVQRGDDVVMRQVLLVGERSGRPLEFGAIRIDLSGFGAEARGEILAARRPLGAILARHGVQYTSRPRCYFSLGSDPCMARLLGLRGPRTLFGRQNILWSREGKPLAEVVEILPPVEPTQNR
jgi:chorismate-pyruvate lyase